MSELVFQSQRSIAVSGALNLPALFVPEARTVERFAEFFTVHIENAHTRRAYYRTAGVFSDWCAGRGIHRLHDVRPMHVAAYIKGLTLSDPSKKQHLAALRMLFDWLVVGNVVEVNPAHAVRGPKHVVTKGQTPVLEREEAHALLDSIEVSTLIGLRDRALIGTMIYTFARIGAVLGMNVGDYYSQGRRGYIRLHEKGGKKLVSPCVSTLETYLDEYIDSAGIAGDSVGPLLAHRRGASPATA